MNSSTMLGERDPRPGDILSARWRLHTPLGHGGMSVVFRGEDVSGRVGAVKVMRSDLELSGGTLRRFLREAVFH